VLITLLTLVVLSLAILVPFLGEDFFPLVDAGQFRLHVSAPVGTRIEDTQHVFTQVEEVIRSVIPKDEIDLVLDNIGLPMNLNIALSDSATISVSDGEILVSLNKEHHGPTWDYVKKIRQILLKKFPDYTFFTQPSDIVGQTLNAGLPAPIDVQVVGHDPQNYQIAEDLRRRMAAVPGAVDVNIYYGIAWSAHRHCVDAIPNPNYDQRAGFDGRNHVYWCGHFQQHFDGHVCERRVAFWQKWV